LRPATWNSTNKPDLVVVVLTVHFTDEDETRSSLTETDVAIFSPFMLKRQTPLVCLLCFSGWRHHAREADRGRQTVDRGFSIVCRPYHPLWGPSKDCASRLSTSPSTPAPSLFDGVPQRLDVSINSTRRPRRYTRYHTNHIFTPNNSRVNKTINMTAMMIKRIWIRF
jgi:hypothetical protein